MAITIQSSFTFGDIHIEYQLDDMTHLIGLMICPAQLAAKRPAHRTHLVEGPEYRHTPRWVIPGLEIDSLAQVKWTAAESTTGFGQGRTMRGGPATLGMKFLGQEVTTAKDTTIVLTHLQNDEGIGCDHRLSWREGDAFVEVITSIHNSSTQAISLELLSSFSLGGMTPFSADDAPDRLKVHRFRSNWSAEGRLDTQSIEHLALERSWSGHGVRCERFGQVGSMPTNGFFPMVALEDSGAGVLWGAQLAWAGSWQMEVYRRDDSLSISGGLADREFGHWVKTLAPGERLESPPAVLSTVAGDLDALCHRLTSAQNRAADRAPAVEAGLPIIFNEWCSSWGRPTHENLIALADSLQGSLVRYLVIDAGWYAPLDGVWSTAQGDWVPNPAHYPQGLAATTAAIRERGLIPGLWFEMEVAGETAAAYQMTDHLLRRDGMTYTVGGRRFWNMNDPFVVDFLSLRVIGLLRDAQIGYLKVDYNETLGLGVDGAESLGEALRQQIQGVYRFFDRIRAELPDLVIENCASGGHRLEPSMLARCSMGSFSDAHEPREIPIIAANLHRLILPRQSQIWVVLHADDDDRRMVYLLASGFLGRMCLSGDITQLTDHQWQLVQQAERLYSRVAPIISHGRSYRFGPEVTSYRHPRGWQAVLRVADDGHDAIVVAHSFGADVPPVVDLPLPAGVWNIAGMLNVNHMGAVVADGQLHIALDDDYMAAVIHLTQ